MFNWIKSLFREAPMRRVPADNEKQVLIDIFDADFEKSCNILLKKVKHATAMMESERQRDALDKYVTELISEWKQITSVKLLSNIDDFIDSLEENNNPIDNDQSGGEVSPEDASTNN